MQKKKISIPFVIRAILVICSFITFGIGYMNVKFNLALIGILLMWTSNILFSFEMLKYRILFLFFNITQFVFLMARPVISMIRGNDWWIYWENAELFAVMGLFLSLSGLHLGAWILSNKKVVSVVNRNVEKETKFRKFGEKYLIYIRIVASIGFVITWVCYMIAGMEKVLFMRGRTYLEFYSSFSSNLPYILIVIGSMMQYFTCILLATKPKKKTSFVILGMFVISAVPSLIVGIRNPIVLNCIFAFLYYFIRDFLEDKEKWIGRWEKIAVIVVAPLAVIFLSLYLNIRQGSKIVLAGIGNTLLDFFYNQGVSFDVLAIGHGALPYLPEKTISYTFGGIIDYIMHGTIAQKFFGATGLPSGNNLVNALESNSFAHNMSYIAKGEEGYLAGEGLGSSYILETYADFGYIGLILFSIVLGALLIYGMSWLKKNMFTFTVTMVALTTIFFVPRAEATGWIQFLLYIQFWVPVIGCIVGAILLKFICDKLNGNKLAEKILILYNEI